MCLVDRPQPWHITNMAVSCPWRGSTQGRRHSSSLDDVLDGLASTGSVRGTPASGLRRVAAHVSWYPLARLEWVLTCVILYD